MSRHSHRTSPFVGFCCRLLGVIAVTLSALLSIGAPRVHAQPPDEYKDHVWHGENMEDRGKVEVDTSSVTVNEGGTVSYRIRLTKQPILTEEEMAAGKRWIVRLHVDGTPRIDEGSDGYDVDGDGETDITWTPNYYREFHRDDWNQWKDIRIRAHPDSDGEDQQITFRHEVWDQHTACPFMGSPVTVLVNDTTNEPVTVSIADAEVVDEGGTALFDVTLNKAPSQRITVEYQTANGSAQAGSDYVEQSGTLTFTSSSTTTQTIPVPTIQDAIREQEETFTVRLSSAATIADGSAIGTISDDDNWDVTIDDVTVEESEGEAVFTVRASGGSQSMTVTYTTEEGTAKATSDYTTTSGTLALIPGEPPRMITVPITDDTTPEPIEKFGLTLTTDNSPLASATGTITDDDRTDFTVGNVTVNEGDRRVHGHAEQR